jgi:transposase
VRTVIDLATESRPEVLRQVALLQQQENAKLQRRIGELVARLAELEGKDATAALQMELVRLQEQLAKANQKLFGRSSEQRPAPTAGDEGAPPEAPAAPRRGHGPRPQPSLPVVEVVHALDAPDQTCTACGGALRAWEGQFEESEEIDVVAASYRVVRHRRQKYTCRCGACVETALGPHKLVAGGRYSVDFAVSVATAKYLDHAPLARQVRQMARAGLAVDTQTLWDQLLVLSRHLEPTYEALHAHVLAAPVIGADETVWPLLEKGGAKRWYAWSVTAPEGVFYRIDPSRSARAAAEILRGYAGIVVCDGYGAYGTLEKASREGEGPAFTLAHCWSHVRRKFFECEAAFPEAAQALDGIGRLYDVEAEAKKAEVADPRAHLATLRAERSRPIVERLRDWMLAQRALPQSGLAKALAYTDGLWPGLVRFLDDPAIPLDNNATERAMRGLVVGRKNHYGSKSLRGTQVAALFYSLLESAKLAGVEPAAYLAEATRRAIAAPGTVTLPSDLAPG